MNWEKVEFNVVNMDELDLSMDAICIPERPGHILMPNRRTFADQAAVCRRFHGKTTVVKDYETQTAVIKAGLEHVESCTCMYANFLSVVLNI